MQRMFKDFEHEQRFPAEVVGAERGVQVSIFYSLWTSNLFLYKLPPLLHTPLSAVRDFRGVGITGQFPALSHSFFLILESRREFFLLNVHTLLDRQPGIHIIFDTLLTKLSINLEFIFKKEYELLSNG